MAVVAKCGRCRLSPSWPLWPNVAGVRMEGRCAQGRLVCTSVCAQGRLVCTSVCAQGKVPPPRIPPNPQTNPPNPPQPRPGRSQVRPTGCTPSDRLDTPDHPATTTIRPHRPTCHPASHAPGREGTTMVLLPPRRFGLQGVASGFGRGGPLVLEAAPAPSRSWGPPQCCAELLHLSCPTAPPSPPPAPHTTTTSSTTLTPTTRRSGHPPAQAATHTPTGGLPRGAVGTP